MQQIQIQINILVVPHLLEVITDALIQRLFECLCNFINISNNSAILFNLFENFVEMRVPDKKQIVKLIFVFFFFNWNH